MMPVSPVSPQSSVRDNFGIGDNYLDDAKTTENLASGKKAEILNFLLVNARESFLTALENYSSLLKNNPTFANEQQFVKNMQEAKDGIQRMDIRLGGVSLDSAKLQESQTLESEFVLSPSGLRKAEDLFGQAVKYYLTAIYSNPGLQNDSEFMAKLIEAQDGWTRTGKKAKSLENKNGEQKEGRNSNKV